MIIDDDTTAPEPCSLCKNHHFGIRVALLLQDNIYAMRRHDTLKVRKHSFNVSCPCGYQTSMPLTQSLDGYIDGAYIRGDDYLMMAVMSILMFKSDDPEYDKTAVCDALLEKINPENTRAIETVKSARSENPETISWMH